MQPDRCSGGVEIMVLASEHSGASSYLGRRRGRREENVICAPVPVLPDLGTCRSITGMETVLWINDQKDLVRP